MPTNVTEVRAFLGTTGFYRRFIKAYATIAKPLTDLTRNDVGSVPESWTPKCTAAFETLRQALMEEPVLTRPNLDKPLILTTDWQPNSVASILSQMSDDGVEQVIAYGSKTLSGAEANWSATEGECWAVAYFTKRWKHFLLGSKFTLITDHAALKYIMTATDTSHKWQCWALKIRGYEVKHRAGKENTSADELSRLQYNTIDETQANRPAERAAAMILQLTAEEMQTDAPADDPDEIDVENVIEGEPADCKYAEFANSTIHLKNLSDAQGVNTLFTD